MFLGKVIFFEMINFFECRGEFFEEFVLWIS